MNQSDNINELVAALAKAQGQMKPAVFNKSNSFFKGSKYADFNSCMEACRTPLANNGIFVLQAAELSEDKPVLITRLYHTTGQWISSTMPLYLKNQDMQGIGSAITYAKRYALAAMLGIVSDEEEDDDAEAAQGRPKNAPPTPIFEYLNASQIHTLLGFIKQLPVEKLNIFNAKLIEDFGTIELDKIPAVAFPVLSGKLSATIKMLGAK